MGIIADIIVFGAIWTAIYSLIAIGFTMIFGVSRIINLAHGAFFMVSSYTVYYFIQRGLGLFPSALIAITFVCLLAVLYYIVLIKPLRESLTRVLIISVGAAMAIEQVILLKFGPDPKYVPSIIEGGFHMLGVRLTIQQLLTFIVAIVLILGIWLLLNKTNFGRIFRAVAHDHEMASIAGINAEKANYQVMIISAGLAAIAGVLVAPFLTVSPIMGWSPILASFTIVVLGGMGNVFGTLVGAVIVAYAEMVTSYAISPQLKEAITFGIMVVALVFRPHGLFGKGVKKI